MRALIRNAQQLQLLRASYLLLKPKSDELIFRSYQRFYQVLPIELNTVIAGDILAFHSDVVASFEVAIQYADRPERLMTVIMPLVSRHLTKKGIRPVHLAIMLNCLMTSAGEILESEWTAEVENSWDEALHTLLLSMLKIARIPSESSSD